MDFSEQLSFILEESPSRYQNNLSDANEIIKEIDKSYQYINILQNKLRNIKRKMNSELAVKIRHKNPSLNISVNPKKCKIGYKTKYLSLYPDVERGIWILSANDDKFKNKFLKQHKQSTVISKDIEMLANSILSYFSDYYKSLNESIVGNGIILIEDNKSNLMNLAKYGN